MLHRSPHMFAPSLKLRKYFTNLQKNQEKRRYGNSKEVRDNKRAYRLSDPACAYFSFESGQVYREQVVQPVSCIYLRG
ncbi:hypothetical protein Barb4_00701 [Bacteroidales bacterium Barb4]|nr:hypothetical protein Barb4_00701 [Bacteroidales bacterium Barb4]